MPAKASAESQSTTAFAVASPRGPANGLRVSIRSDKPLPWLSVQGWNFDAKQNLSVGMATDKLFWRTLRAVCDEVLAKLD